MPIKAAPLLPKAAAYFENKQPTTFTKSQENTLLNDARGASNDEAKYQAAVDMARMSLQDSPSISEDIFKEAIDTYYDQMNPEKTGREMRGENAWTDFIGGTKDAINGFNTAIGNGIDWAFDNTVGNAIGAIDKNAGEKVKGFMSGEDLSIVPDIATDIALIASGWGIPVAVAKNAIQLSDYMGNAVSGKDNITLEDLGDGQRLANAALGFGGTALAAIPGVGKGVNIAKTASKDAASDAFSKAAKTFESSKALDDAVEAASKKAQVPFEGQPLKANESIFADKNVQKALDAITDSNGKVDTKALNVEKAQKTADEAKEWLDKGVFERAMDIMAKDTKGMLKAGTVDVPSQVAKGFKEARDLGKLRGTLKEANKIAGKNKTEPAKELKKLADKEGLDVSKYLSKGPNGEEIFSPPTRGLNPIQQHNARKKGAKLAQEEINAAEKIPRKEAKQIKEQYKQAAIEEALNNQPLAISKISGLIPGLQVAKRGTQNSFRNVLNNIMRNSSTQGRALNDTQAKELEEAIRRLSGTPKGEALSNQAKGFGSRLASTGGGLLAGVGAAPTAYYAQNGGEDFFDAGADWFRSMREAEDYGSVLPMLLPLGTKSVSKRVNPGLKGNLNSTIPHMAMRAPATAARMELDDKGYSTENEGFSAAVEKLLNNKKEN